MRNSETGDGLARSSPVTGWARNPRFAGSIPPPQPSQPAARGRPFLATSSHLWRLRAWPPDSVSTRLGVRLPRLRPSAEVGYRLTSPMKITVTLRLEDVLVRGSRSFRGGVGFLLTRSKPTTARSSSCVARRCATIARELVETVRKNVTIDWTLRENIRAQLRVLVKRILRKHGYPSDKQEKATQTVLGQAALLSADWAVA